MSATHQAAADVVRAVERILACPRCHGSLSIAETAVACRSGSCGYRGAIVNGVVVLNPGAAAAFFDEMFEVMQHGSEGEGVRDLCYVRQAEFIQPRLSSGSVVLDIGCGPALPYVRNPGCFLIGLDASYASVRANSTVDLRVYGTATALPLPNRSVDTILCLYSVHHMIGDSIGENRCIVREAMSEFARVLKPGGDLLVFEVSPWLPFWIAEQAAWSVVRRFLGSRLPAYFWSPGALISIARRAFPAATFERIAFKTSLLRTFPPAFGLPWLKVPRMFYPFSVNLYRWSPYLENGSP